MQVLNPRRLINSNRNDFRRGRLSIEIVLDGIQRFRNVGLRGGVVAIEDAASLVTADARCDSLTYPRSTKFRIPLQRKSWTRVAPSSACAQAVRTPYGNQ